MVNIEVNNQPILAKEGETILDALNRNGIKVPTLCRMEGFSPTGACRLCVVEAEGKPGLIPSCSFQVEEALKIKTHSPRVIRSRKMLVELLLSNHPDDCLYCVRNGNCELQDLAIELNIRERRISGNKSKVNLDQSSPGIVRDPAKCVLCGRCVRVCEEVQTVSTFDFIKRGNKTSIATTMNKDLNFSNCVHCGQCIMVCPTGALHEKINFDVLLEMLNNKDTKVIVQYSPTIAVSVAEDLGIRSGKDISGLINAALRKIGFYKVFDTTFGSDLLIYEQSAELLDRIKYDNNLPLISSCCPGWIKYMEQSHFDLMENVSTCKSAQQMMGTLIKGYFAQEEKISPEKIFSVSIMPCTAKKFEAQREEMTHKGISDIDLVLTSRELVKLINICGIDVQLLQEEMADNPFNIRSSAGKLVSVSGGMTEAIVRTTHFLYSKKEIPEYKITKLRGTKERREMNIQIGDLNLGVAVVSGLKNAKNLLEEIRNGRKDLHYIEIMACPGGCINGGGQPFCSDEKVMKSRAKAVYDIDEKDGLKVAHKNPAIIRLYEKFLEEPLSVKANSLLHTRYSERDVLL
jgi:iron-only hydrogenase group A